MAPVRKLDLAISILNGLVGDYLDRTGNGLATPMAVYVAGKPVTLEKPSLQQAFPNASSKVVVLVHGLMSNETLWRFPDGTTYGSRLEADHGCTAVYVRYNTGLHISENGRLLDGVLDGLFSAFPKPIEDLALLGHSMGGLVMRSACHVANEAQRPWLAKVSRAYYVAAPHLGAPLERAGNVVTWALERAGDPTTKLIADVAKLRSAGVKDLRYGNLHDDDWTGADADALLQDRRNPVPLLPHIRHHLIAGTVSDDPRLGLLFGDAMVSVHSATGVGKRVGTTGPLPADRVKILTGVTHAGMMTDEQVDAQIRAWHGES